MSDETTDPTPQATAKPRRRKPASENSVPEPPPIVLTDVQRALVDELLFSESDHERGAVVDRMANLPELDRESVGGALMQQIKAQTNAVLRSWIVSAIGATHPQGGAEAISRQLDARREDDSMVRFWAAIRFSSSQYGEKGKTSDAECTAGNLAKQPTRVFQLSSDQENSYLKKQKKAVRGNLRSRFDLARKPAVVIRYPVRDL